MKGNFWATLAIILFATNSLANQTIVNQPTDHLEERKSADFYEIRLAEPILEEELDISFVGAEYFEALAEECRLNMQSQPSESTDTFGKFPSIDKIINIGRKIWKIIDDGKPTVEIKTASAHALPKGVRCWQELEGWRAPRVKRYSAVYENVYGIEVVRFAFKVIYIYGGQLDGKGRFLTGIRVIPEKVKVLWGFDLNANAKVPSVVNMGSKRNPKAGAEIQVQWTVKSVLKEIRREENFFVTGTGEFSRL